MADKRTGDDDDQISIIGIGCRFPGGVTDTDSFWELLCNEEPAIKAIPKDRGWDPSQYVVAGGAPGTSVTDRAGWVDEVDRFDPQCFQISPKEAAEMDPQQRLVMECTYEALNDAYINPATLAGSKTGVFVGSGIAEYMAMAFGDPNNMTMHTMSGNSLAVIANRVSYTWDLRGPSLTTDTACSSAMTAFHLAVQSLKAGDCDMAIVSGVNTLLGPSPFIGFTQAQMLSPTGTSRPFDENANGFVRGEGCGVLILGRNVDPVKNRIYAHVRGSGINEDGRTKSITMPSEESQRNLMCDVITNSDTKCEDIMYVEAHGTGTKVGDPIEARSISASTVGNRPSNQPLLIGSAKGHVGHLETAAGAVGLIKAALVVYNGSVPPTAGFTSISPNIDANDLKISVAGGSVQQLGKPASGGRPLASVNSYGFGGGNGYAILEQADGCPALQTNASAAEEEEQEAKNPVVLVMSSHFKEGLAETEAKWLARDGDYSSANAKNGAFKLSSDSALFSVSRPLARYRKVMVGSAGVNSLASPKVQAMEGEHVGGTPQVLCCFGGQGSQYPHMGRDLYSHFPVFKQAIDALVAIHEKVSGGVNLISAFGFCVREMDETQLGQVLVSVPSIVYVQVALMQLLRSAGVEPAAVVGHSTGEMVAAFAAGCLDYEGVVRLTFTRATAQQAMGEGSMAAWAASAEDAQATINELGLGDKVALACVNTPTGVTLAGEIEAVAAVVKHGKATGTRCTVLKIPRAYHSSHVDPVKDQFLELAGDLEAGEPKVPFLSATEGQRRTTPPDAKYWFSNMRNAVQFSAACGTAARLGESEGEPELKIALEISPHAVLMPYCGENMPGLTYIPTLNKKKPAVLSVLTALAQLYTAGVSINWQAVLMDETATTTATRMPSNLPGTVWQHKNAIRSVSWKNPYHGGGGGSKSGGGGGEGSVVFTPSAQPYLQDHVVDGEVILPGAAYVSVALGRAAGKGVLTNMLFERYLPLWKGDADPMTGEPATSLSCVADGPRVRLCTYQTNGDKTEEFEHFACTVPRFAPDTPAPLLAPSTTTTTDENDNTPALVKLHEKLDGDINLPLSYKSMEKHSGLNFGPSFKSLTSIKIGSGSDNANALATINPPPAGGAVGEFPVHPTVLDACFQTLAFLHGLDSDSFVPNELAHLAIIASGGVVPSRELQAHAVLTSTSRDVVTGDIDLYDPTAVDPETNEKGVRVAAIRGLKLRRAPSSKSKAPTMYKTQMQPLEFQAAAATTTTGASTNAAATTPIADLYKLVGDKLNAGFVVRMLGLEGSATSLLSLAKQFAVDDAACPLRTGQLLLVSLDSEEEVRTAAESQPEGGAEGLSPEIATGAIRCVPEENIEDCMSTSWDALVCGTDPELYGTAQDAAAKYLRANAGAVISAQTSFMRYMPSAIPSSCKSDCSEESEDFNSTAANANANAATSATTSTAVNVLVLGTEADKKAVAAGIDSDKFELMKDGTSSLSENLLDATYVIDCRNNLTAASALTKKMVDTEKDAENERTLAFVIPQSATAPSPLWGFARCARNETGCTVVALGLPANSTSLTVEVAASVVSVLAAGTPDQELTFDNAQQGWMVPRLMPVTGVTAETEASESNKTVTDVRLQIGRPGQLSTLHWHPLQSEYEGLRPDEVLVENRAVSLHFKDVMLAMGMLGDFKPIIGMECAGVVKAVGSATTRFKPGDKVMCLAMSTSTGEERSALFGTRCVSQERQTVKCPDNVSTAEASGFLGVMATAWHALMKVAHLEKEDTVLIHSTLGGVGQSALQIAKMVGATVIGSAGNPEKRQKLMDMGVDFVMDSHNPAEFQKKVREFTNGRGVDVVLNSLAGDGQAETLQCMAPCGRFVEIGKADILKNKRMNLGSLKENISFYSVHLDLLDKTHPHKVRALIDECAEHLASGKLHPIPTTTFPAAKAVDAFKLMASGKHTGKLVVEFPEEGFTPDTTDHLTGQPRLPQTLFSADKTVCVTGGTRGLGLEVARWAADKGAMHFVLLSASGKVPADSQLLMNEMQEQHPGLHIAIEKLDVRDASAVKALFTKTSPPIGSVFHAANQYTAEDATNVQELGPAWAIKVDGALNLKAAAQQCSITLDAFVMFTSLAGLHGNKGQAVYVAANAAMQRLASTWRREENMAATAIDFPIVVGAGRLKEFLHASELELNTGRGFGAISFSKIEAQLAKIVAHPLLYPAHLTLDNPEWSSYHQLNRNPMLFDHLAPIATQVAAGADGATAGSGAVVVTQTPEQVTNACLGKIAFVLGADMDEVELDVPMPEMGVDSLAAVELANWAQTTYGVTVSQTEFLSGLTPQGFLDRILTAVADGAAAAPAPVAAAPKAAAAAPAAPVVEAHRQVAVSIEQPQSSGYGGGNDSATTASSTAVSTYSGYSNNNSNANVAIGNNGERIVSLSETLNPNSLRNIVDLVDGGSRQKQVLVFRGTSTHFCTGMDLAAATFGDDTMSEGLEEFARLSDALTDTTMPSIAVCHGATRGGGMLFPCLATVTLAIRGATFGFPEIRQGGLPGVVSVAAQRRMSGAVCQRWMCTGDAYTAEQAQAAGLVDFVGTEQEVERELKRLLGRFKSFAPELLSKCKTKCPAKSIDQALLAMGSLDQRDRVREREADALVALRHDPETGVAILELNDPTHCNAIDWAMADDLRRRIEQLKNMDDVRAIVFQGLGDHFCVGVNPYNFIRRTKQLPTITSGQITYEIYRAFVGLRDIGCPVVCAVHGKVVGGGLAACLNADYRIAHETAMFNYGNLPRGVCPGLLLSHNLKMTVGHKNATDLYMNDITVSAVEAKEMGLVNETYATVAETQNAAYEFALRMASYPSVGVRATLGLMRPPIDEVRLASECMGIARCNKKGNAFSGNWKQKARRVGEKGTKFNTKGASLKTGTTTTTTTSVAPPQAPIVASAEVGRQANTSAWTDFQRYFDEWKSKLPSTEGYSPKAGAPTGSVFLTGSTGFLGAFILRDLLQAGMEVVTLVRADDEVKGMARLASNMHDYGLWEPSYEMQITVRCGDLVSERFGMSTTQWNAAASECDLLIHNGADVNFSCKLEELMPTNVGGTVRALSLAAQGSMRYTQVSSLSVFSLYHFVGDASTHRPDPRILINGYARSKWLSEQMVWEAGKSGLKVNVVRPGRIMGDSSTGAANLKDWFARYVLTCVQMRQAWDVEHDTDMSQVDAVSQLVVEAALDPAREGKCYHAVSLENLTTYDITRFLVAKGYPLAPVPYSDWMGRVKAIAANSAMAPLLDTFASLPIEETNGQRLAFSSDMPHRNGSGTDQLERMVVWMQKSGFLPKPSAVPGSLALPTPPPLVQQRQQQQQQQAASSQPAPVAPQSIPQVVHKTLGAQNAGIHAFEIYSPNHYVEQKDMEDHHGCPGKYTAGLLQEQIGFCGDDEDAVSMALTVVSRLMERTGIAFSEIGRLEVGTESLLDRSKSIKTHLMTLFEAHGCRDLEGVDNYNACYGGTAAFLNSMGWLQSPAWESDGRYAIVVCVDIADLDAHQSFLNGASAVAMLLGPDAPVVLENERASCMLNTWDFYKPVGWKDSYPLMRDGKHSIDCYMTCLDTCYKKLNERIGKANDKLDDPAADLNLVKDNDYFVNHCTSTYLCKRAFKRTCENAFPRNAKGVSGIKLKEQQQLYVNKVHPSTLITKRVGSSYTASCYTNLVSLFATEGQKMLNKSVVVFSYGSGSASTMYRLKINSLPKMDPNPFSMLDRRVRHKPESYIEMIHAYSTGTYGKFGFKPKDWGGKQSGVYYLTEVDEWGKRLYEKEGN